MAHTLNWVFICHFCLHFHLRLQPQPRVSVLMDSAACHCLWQRNYGRGMKLSICGFTLPKSLRSLADLHLRRLHARQMGLMKMIQRTEKKYKMNKTNDRHLIKLLFRNNHQGKRGRAMLTCYLPDRMLLFSISNPSFLSHHQSYQNIRYLKLDLNRKKMKLLSYQQKRTVWSILYSCLYLQCVSL